MENDVLNNKKDEVNDLMKLLLEKSGENFDNSKKVLFGNIMNNSERLDFGDIYKRVKKTRLLAIEEWLDEMGIKNYDIDENTLDINVDGDVFLETYIGGTELPEFINFGVVKGNFTIQGGDGCIITSLRGCPKEVGKNFVCGGVKSDLLSLRGCPSQIGGYFLCSFAKSLTSIEYSPEYVGGDFDLRGCNNIPLDDIIENFPEYVGGKFCFYGVESLGKHVTYKVNGVNREKYLPNFNNPTYVIELLKLKNKVVQMGVDYSSPFIKK